MHGPCHLSLPSSRFFFSFLSFYFVFFVRAMSSLAGPVVDFFSFLFFFFSFSCSVFQSTGHVTKSSLSSHLLPSTNRTLSLLPLFFQAISSRNRKEKKREKEKKRKEKKKKRQALLFWRPRWYMRACARMCAHTRSSCAHARSFWCMCAHARSSCSRSHDHHHYGKW